MSEPVFEWLYSLHRLGMKLDLENMQALLERLDRPERRFRSVLVAGTNGKGSVAAMLEAILSAAAREGGDAPVGLYTSPHLVAPGERIRIGGADLDDSALGSAAERMRTLVDGMMAGGALESHPTFFEIMTAIAFDEFARRGVSMAVLEVGLGGRLDATNAADPDLSLVTTVDLDHQELLGDTLAAIAREKAGVFRAGRPARTGETKPEPLAVLRAEAARTGAALHEISAECSVTIRDEGLDPARPLLRFDLTTPLRTLSDLSVPLPGAHQGRNAALAVRAAEMLGGVSESAIRSGLAATRWPGRLQWLRWSDDPEGSRSPALLLDCAHNPAGAAALGSALAALAPRPVVLVFAAMRDKEISGIAQALAPAVASAVVTRPEVERAAEPEALAAALTAARPGLPVAAIPDVGAALAAARETAGSRGVVCVAGSIFLVGEVLAVVRSGPKL